MIWKLIGTWFLIVILVICVGFLVVWPMVWAWNYVMPTLFNVPEITYWQMFWLYMLIHCLFKLNVTINNKK